MSTKKKKKKKKKKKLIKSKKINKIRFFFEFSKIFFFVAFKIKQIKPNEPV